MDKPLKSVTHGQFDMHQTYGYLTSPRTSLPCIIATKLYCLVKEAHVCVCVCVCVCVNDLPKVVNWQ